MDRRCMRQRHTIDAHLRGEREQAQDDNTGLVAEHVETGDEREQETARQPTLTFGNRPGLAHEARCAAP